MMPTLPRGADEGKSFAGNSWGLMVLKIDPQRVPASPRATTMFERLYQGQTASERVDGRLTAVRGNDCGAWQVVTMSRAAARPGHNVSP